MILTTSGWVTYYRYSLVPADQVSRDRLMQLENVRSIHPLDSAIHADKLPFKTTVNFMLDVCWHSVNAKSYQHAEDGMSYIHRKELEANLEDKSAPTIVSFDEGKDERDDRLTITSQKRANRNPLMFLNDDTIREMTNYVGKIIYMEDCRLAMAARHQFETKSIPMLNDIDDTLYIMMDGAALNTVHHVDHTIKNDSSWKENKLCVAFLASNTREKTVKNEKGEIEIRHEILSKEFISYTGSVDEFKWHVLALALRHGYGRVKRVVIIGDGATWIMKMQKDLFPDATLILDLFHIKEKTSELGKEIWKDPKIRDAMIAKTISLLENGKWEKALAILKPYTTNSEDEDAKKTSADELYLNP